MTGADEWVKAAMADDTMVVELLVRLHSGGGCAARPPLEWSVRQRRSKSVSPMVGYSQKRVLSERASPATPLSWSGGTSLSGGSGGSGGGGGEESSSRLPLRKPSAAARSKDNDNSEKNAPKRPRKKKTLAELKGEEKSLQLEKRELKREIATLRLNLEKQRATNENLKRMKIELGPPNRPPPMADESILDQPTRVQEPSEFFLPDLNIPVEDDPMKLRVCVDSACDGLEG